MYKTRIGTIERRILNTSRAILRRRREKYAEWRETRRRGLYEGFHGSSLKQRARQQRNLREHRAELCQERLGPGTGVMKHR